jgi:hypothetical protein
MRHRLQGGASEADEGDAGLARDGQRGAPNGEGTDHVGSDSSTSTRTDCSINDFIGDGAC